MKRRTTFTLLATAIALQGCANVGNARHMAGGEFKSAPAIQTIPKRGTIILMREYPLMAMVAITRLPAIPLAFDGRMVAMMPVGSSIALSVEPGQHTVSMPRGLGYPPMHIAVVVDAGEQKFVEVQHSAMGWPSVVPIDAQQGRQAYTITSQAAILHNGLPLEVYLERVRATTPDLAGAITSATPSSQTVKNAMETIGAIAWSP